MVPWRLDLTPGQRQFLIITTASIGCFMSGTYVGWASSITRLLRKPGNQLEVLLTDQELAWIISWLDFGMIFSPFLCYYFMEKYGRKLIIITTALLSTLSWIILYESTDIRAVYIARIVQGLHSGISLVVCPIYNSEVSSARSIDFAFKTITGMYSAGILFSYLVGWAATLDTLNFYCLIVSVIYFCLSFNLLETPYYYLMIDDETSARDMDMLVNSNFHENQFQRMRASVKEELETKTLRNVFLSKTYLKPLAVILFLALASRLTFFWNLPSYAMFIFSQTSSEVSSEAYSIFLGFVLFLATFPSSYLGEKVSRRQLVLLSAVCTATFAFMTGCYFYFVKTKNEDYGWIVLIFISSFAFSAIIGISQIQMVHLQDYFPSTARALVSAILISTSGIFGFIADILFEFIAKSLGIYVNYILSCSIAFVITLFTWFFMPESQGQTLHDVQVLFKNPAMN